MERKTFVDNDGFYIDGINGKVWSDMRGRFRGKAIDRLAAYEDTGLEPEEIKDQIGWLSPVCFGCEGRNPDFSRNDNCGYERDEFRLCLERSKHLTDLVNAEQEGRLVVLPCKVGDTVYWIKGKAILEVYIQWFETNAYGWCACGTYPPMAIPTFRFADFGKTVFLTREEAEAALEKEVEDDGKVLDER